MEIKPWFTHTSQLCKNMIHIQSDERIVNCISHRMKFTSSYLSPITTMRFILLWIICVQVQIVLNPPMHGGPCTMVNQNTNILAQSQLYGLILSINTTGVLPYGDRKSVLVKNSLLCCSLTAGLKWQRFKWRCDLVCNQRRKLCSTHHSSLE